MIRFSLQCSDAHRFDGWFRSGDDFLTQQKRGLLACPECGTTSVEKALMTPSVPKKSNQTASMIEHNTPEAETDTASPAPSAPGPAATPPVQGHPPQAPQNHQPPQSPQSSQSLQSPQGPQNPFAGMPPELRGKVMTAVREWRDAVIANSENVGPQFAEEARKIHFKETEERPIYGEASADEVQELLEDGIPCAPLPVLPEDHN